MTIISEIGEENSSILTTVTMSAEILFKGKMRQVKAMYCSWKQKKKEKSYLHKVGFSLVAVIKSMHYEKINMEQKRGWLAISNLNAQFEKLYSTQQAYTSH